jgi:hypothetical protein
MEQRPNRANNVPKQRRLRYSRRRPALDRRLRLPHQKAKDAKVFVSVDLSEINHKPLPARSSGDHQAITARLKASIEVLQMELAKVEASAAGLRADFDGSASVPMR